MSTNPRARANTHTHTHTHTQEHVLARKSLVSTLIQFYVDIEIMGREFDGGRCVCVCVYTHTCVYTHIHTYIQTHIHTFLHRYIHKHIHAYIGCSTPNLPTVTTWRSC